MQRKIAHTVLKIAVGLGLVGVLLFGQCRSDPTYEWHELLWMLIPYLIGSALIWAACFSGKRILTNVDGRDDWYTITAEFVSGAMIVIGYVYTCLVD